MQGLLLTLVRVCWIFFDEVFELCKVFWSIYNECQISLFVAS